MMHCTILYDIWRLPCKFSGEYQYPVGSGARASRFGCEEPRDGDPKDSLEHEAAGSLGPISKGTIV